MSAPKVLVVGAGAVGQVFGRHAQLGGADVTFYVRDKYRDDAARGFELYPLNHWRGGEPTRFDGFAVVTRADEVAAHAFDHVILTVSSTALAGAWLPALLAAIGDATVIVLQPAPDDRATVIAAGAAAERVVSGMISLISYHAPLPGETRFPRPGMAYWFPPLAPCPFSGPRARIDAVVALLRAGGLPSKRAHDVAAASAFPSAVMMPYLAALEGAGWSIGALAHDGLEVGARAAREALAVVALSAGRVPFAMRVVARPTVLRVGLWLARRIVPLPLDIYLREHFTKVGDQTRMMMAGYIARGKQAGVEVSALEQLTRALMLA